MNESAKLVARSLELLKGYKCKDDEDNLQILADSIVLLEEALEKLTA